MRPRALRARWSDPRWADPRRGRFLTPASLGWVIRNRAVTPWHLLHYWRFLRFKLANPHVLTAGLVFLGRGVEVSARPGYGRILLGRWVHLGNGTALRCHEGTLTVGDKVVMGSGVVVNSYLDVSIGAASMLADLVHVTDFDHVTTDPTRPIKDQGIVKSPVRIGADVWLGTKATVLRGVSVGAGCVVGANAVVTRDLPPYSIAVGAPARVVGRRGAPDAAAEPAGTASAMRIVSAAVVAARVLRARRGTDG